MEVPSSGAPGWADVRARRGRTLWWVMVAGVGVLGAQAARTYLNGYIGDFSHFYYAAKAVREGVDPYSVHERGYLYLPLLAILMVPLTVLPIGWAGAVWAMVNAFMLGAVLVLGAREFARRLGSEQDRLAISVAALVTLGVLLDKTRTELRLGQTDVLIALGLVVALRAIGTRPALCGACVAIVTCVKFQGVLFLIYLLVRRRYQEAVWACVGIVALTLSGALVFGWSRNLEYLGLSLRGVSELVGQAEGSERSTLVFPLEWIRSVSVPSVLARLEAGTGGGPAVIFGGSAAAALAMLVIGWWMYARHRCALLTGRGGDGDDRDGPSRGLVALEWAGLVVAALAFSPQTTSRHLFLLVVPVMLGSILLVERREGVKRSALLIATVVLTLGLVLPPGQEERSNTADAWRRIGGAMWCVIAYWFVVLWTGLGWIRQLRTPTR